MSRDILPFPELFTKTLIGDKVAGAKTVSFPDYSLRSSQANGNGALRTSEAPDTKRGSLKDRG